MSHDLQISWEQVVGIKIMIWFDGWPWGFTVAYKCFEVK